MTVELAELPNQLNCHDFEADVRRELLSTAGVTVSNLVVRRLPNGVCLQGVLNVEDESVDICDAVRKVPGVQQILNRMVMRTDPEHGCLH